MTSLLNRFAWIISIILAVTLTWMFFIWEFWYRDIGYLSFWTWAIGGFIIKKIFFSYSLIEDATKGMNHISSTTNQSSIIEDIKIQDIVDWASDMAASARDLSFVTAVIGKNQEVHQDMVDENHMESAYASSEPVVVDEPSALSIWIHNFFSDRPLAKIGGILLFLGALFFLGLIFVAIGPVGRVLMGILFGFFLIGIGVWLDNKDIKTEARVLFGIGIAINYLTILFGRHLLTGSDAIMSDGFATFALLLNTGLAITLALVYRSRVLLGFAFILAYATPFLVGSESSNVVLLVIYTTILTLAISIINGFYSRMHESESIEYLEWIGIVGMTVLFSIAGLSKSNELIFVFIGLGISVLALSFFSYQQRRSPIAIFVAAYIVLLISSIAGSTLFLLPFCIISLLALSLFFVFQNLISIVSLLWFGVVSFFLGLFGFWFGWSIGIGTLFFIGISVFGFLWFASIKMVSNLLSSVAVIGFGIIVLLGITSMNIMFIDNESILLVKLMSIILLVWASVFTLRLRDAFTFFLAVLMSGILMVYPNTFETHMGITILAFIVYIFASLIIPYILTRSENVVIHRAFLLASLPLSALVVSYGIYELGHEKFPWIAMGLAYILQASLYLWYAMIAGSKFFPKSTWETTNTTNQDNKNILIVLFALPLSLFTFSLAFLFQDTPGVMSLAWILESAILYMIAVRMNDARIFTGATLVFAIGIIREVSLIESIRRWDFLMFGILVLMLVSVISSLVILRREKWDIRISYDIIHMISILTIGYGISRIIPSTGHGWSIFGPALLILVLEYIYTSFGNKIHHIFVSILFGFLCIGFIGGFDSLHREVPYFFIQMAALFLITIIGYLGYRSRTSWGSSNLGIATIGFLWISSLYVNDSFGVFAVSIYLTIIASTLIIHGITTDNPRIRTMGLYIGIFVLVKILFYDIWNGSGNLIVRVLALMVAWGLMIYLSQLYGKYVSRGWSLELSFSNIIGDIFTLWDDIEESISQKSTEPTMEINPFIWELEIDLKDIMVSEFSGVSFISTSWETFTVKRVGVIRLAKYITDTLKRANFAPNELISSYEFVMKNMVSVLPKNVLDNLLGKFQKWIKEGGKIEFIQKSK